MLSVAPILGVNDVQATVDWFVESLGFSMVNVFGMPADEGPVTGSCIAATWRFLYRFAEYQQSGVTMFRETCDEDYGVRDFCIETPDGHRIAFGSPLDAA